jgi:SAM-dependent methyltransferase
MMKDLFSIGTTTLIAWAAVGRCRPRSLRKRRNRYMHQSDFDKLAARFEGPARAEWQKPEKAIASLGPLKGQNEWPTIGAGTGYFSFPIAKQARKVIAIDIDQRFLDYMRAEETNTEHRSQHSRPVCTKPDSPASSRAKPIWC